MSTGDWALFLHLFGVLVLAGGLAVAAVAQWGARRCTRPEEVARVLGLARMGVLLVGIGSAVVVAAGFWLIEVTGHGLDEAWVSGSLGLVVFALVLGALGGQRPKQARLLAERAGREGVASVDEIRRLLRDPLSAVLNWTATASIVAALLLMVWKPG